MPKEWTEQDEDQRLTDRGDEEVERYDNALKANGIHVGRGSPPICVVDDEAWPCAHLRHDEHSELTKAKHLDPVGYVQRHDDNTITFAVGGHTHHVSRQSAIQLARGIYDSLERY